MPVCPICKDSGLVPFKNRHDAWVDCTCKEDIISQGARTSDDFDFACSDTFRGYYHERYDGTDPAFVPPVVEREPEVIYRTQPSGELESIKGQVLYLQEKLLKHITPKKQVNKPQEYGDISV